MVAASSEAKIRAADENHFNNCDFYVQLDANEGKSVINPGGYISTFRYFGYLGFFDPGSSCRYFIECPRNYIIRLYCYVNIAVTVRFEIPIEKTPWNQYHEVLDMHLSLNLIKKN